MLVGLHGSVDAMPHAFYSKRQLVEQPAIGLFAEIGWAVIGPSPNAGVAGEPRDTGLLGRETKGEVVLVSRLRAVTNFGCSLLVYSIRPIESDSQTQPINL